MADYYQLLGLGPQASVAEIRQAYSRLAREKHPDRFQDADEKQKAQRLFQDITTAFNTLSNPRSRQEYDQARDRPQPKTPEEIATDAFESSQAALEAGDLSQAVTLLHRAVHHAPGNVGYQLALGRALGRATSREAQRDAVAILERVIQVSPQNAAAFLELAGVLARSGLKLRAQKTVEAGLRVDPRNAKLLRLAAELGVEKR
jgi:curved DNA-binding protein CbpA